ncbi:MAG TPA: hypothetical protein VGG85_14900 [Terracidiphilus sp.]
MKRKWIFLLAPPALVLFLAICGEVVMHLWNWLLPSLFGWHPLTFWQALGLLVLCRMLFGGFGGHGGDRRRARRDERWERMTPEDREQFRQRMRNRCGFGPPSGDIPPGHIKEPA